MTGLKNWQQTMKVSAEEDEPEVSTTTMEASIEKSENTMCLN